MATRVGLIGIGGYGDRLCRTILDTRDSLDCHLVAAADGNLGARPREVEKLQQLGVQVFDDGMELIERMRGACDIMVIATSIPSHAPLTITAARAGYAIHVEKPPAGTIQEVDAMLEAVEGAGTMAMVGFMNIHGHALQWLKEQRSHGALGDIKAITCSANWPRGSIYYNRNGWAGKLRVGESWVLDGPAQNALAHPLNNMLFLASAKPQGFAVPTSVQAELYAAGPVDSHNTASMRVIADGIPVYFHCSHAGDESFGPVITLHGTTATATFSPGQGSTITGTAGQVQERPPDHDEHARMFTNLVDAWQGENADRLRCSLLQARNMTLALNGAHESSAQIHRIGDAYFERVTDDKGDTRTVVPGLCDLLARAEGEQKLLSELENAPAWAVSTQPFVLEGYRSFPQRFRIV